MSIEGVGLDDLEGVAEGVIEVNQEGKWGARSVSRNSIQGLSHIMASKLDDVDIILQQDQEASHSYFSRIHIEEPTVCCEEGEDDANSEEESSGGGSVTVGGSASSSGGGSAYVEVECHNASGSFSAGGRVEAGQDGSGEPYVEVGGHATYRW